MSDDSFDFMFHVDDNIADTLNRLGKMSKELGRVQDELSKVGDIAAKDVGKNLIKLEQNMGDFYDIAKKAGEEVVYGQHFKDAAKEVSGVTTNLKKLRKQQDSFLEAQASGNEELAKQKAAQYRETFKMISKEKKAVMDSMTEQSKRLKKVFVEDKKKLDDFQNNDLPKSLGTGIGKAIQSALSGDIGGIVGGLGQSAGSVAELGAGRLRNRSQKKGLQRQMSGGKQGALAKGGGKVMQALGKMGKFLGPLAVAVGGLAAIVKILMDAEAQTKELNKELLSQVPYYSLATSGLGDVDTVLGDMRESATDFSTNMKLGLEPKQHYEVIGALIEHNVNLKELASEYGSFGEMATTVVSDIRRHSLNTGASLQETSQFFAQMADLHNRTFEDVSQDMSMVAMLASEAGVSTKKFFGVVSQLSGQMGLYNYKLEDTAMLLANMNKIMDSKSAEEFTTSMTTGLKDMNGQDRLRKIILAGQVKMQRELRTVVKDMFVDIQKVDSGFVKINGILKSMGHEGVQNAAELQQRLKDLRKAGDYQEFMYRTNTEAGEKVGRALSMAGKMSADVEAGGLRLADALGNLGAMGNIEMEISIAEKILGPIQDIPLIMAESMGYTEKQLKQMQRFSEISRGQTKILQRQYKNFQEGLIDEKDFAAFAKGMGIDAVIKEGQMVNEKTNQLIKDEYDVQRAMTADAKDRAKEASKVQMTTAEKQVAATQKVSDLLQYLIYDALDSISGAVEGVYGFLVKVLSFLDGSPPEEKSDVQKRERKKEIRTTQKELRSLRRERMKATTEDEKEALTGKITTKERELRYAEQIDQNLNDKGEGVSSDSGYKKHVMGGGDLSLNDYLDLKDRTSRRVRSEVEAHVDANSSDGGVYLPTGQARKQEKNRLIKEKSAEALPLEIETLQKLSKSGNELQAEILAGITDGDKSRAEQEAETNRILEKNGININTSAAKKFKEAQIEALQVSQMTDKLRGSFGGHAGTVAQMLYSTGGSAEGVDAAAQFGATLKGQALTAMQKQALATASGGGGVKPTQDAKILTRGIAPLAFAPGDLVIKEEALARTQTGGSGSMLKSLANSMGGGGRGSNMTFNITVNGGNPNDVREEIVKAYEMIKRKEMGG